MAIQPSNRIEPKTDQLMTKKLKTSSLCFYN